MSPEDFKNIAQGLQAVLIGFTAFSGGIWALFRFGITREFHKAKLELENLQKEAYLLRGSVVILIFHIKKCQILNTLFM
jgi:hypothetical protein